MIIICYKLQKKSYTNLFFSKKIEIEFKKGEKNNAVSIVKIDKNILSSYS